MLLSLIWVFCNHSGAESFFTLHSHAFIGGCSNFYEETFAGQGRPGGKCKERFSMNSLFASNFIYSFQIFVLTLFFVIHTEFA